MMKFLGLIILLLMVGCQLTPTKVYETQPVTEKSGQEIPAGTIILDARPVFEYSLAHLNGAIPMRWEDFTQREEPFLGVLEVDQFFHARRLARLGIKQDSSVLVVGRGLQGEGEEGRLAWTLKVLGIKNVSFAHIDSFSLPLTKSEAPPRENVSMWKPIFDDSLVITREEFLTSVIKAKGTFDPPVVIDVRTEAQYLGKDSNYYSLHAPDIGAVNIPWTEFLTREGRANTQIKDRLQSVGINPNKKIICLDEKGVRSATVTLILRELGYSKATNFAGGYMLLMGKR